MKKISIIGLGFVGLPLACILSRLKLKVIGIDKKVKFNKILSKKKIIRSFSSGLVDKKLISILKKSEKDKKFIFTNSFESISESDVVVVSVNFDFKTKSIKKSFTQLKNLFKKIANNLSEDTLIMLETTIPPGTSEKIIFPLITKILKKRRLNIKKIYFSYSYERVMPGKNYYNSIVNINRCYAGINDESFKKCEKFLKLFINDKQFPLHKLNNIRSCETSKILENTYRAVNIAFIDEWTRFAHKIGVNLNEVIDGIKLRSTHNNIMRPGLGVGGYCLTKDPEFVKISSKYIFKTKSNFPITSRSLNINKNMTQNSFNFLKRYFFKKSLKILILGGSYREDVGDIRFSSSIDLFKKLKKNGHDVIIHDPIARGEPINYFVKKIPNSNSFDMILFCVAHKQYKKMNLSKLSKKPLYFDLNLVLSNKKKRFLKKNNYKLKVLGDD